MITIKQKNKKINISIKKGYIFYIKTIWVFKKEDKNKIRWRPTLPHRYQCSTIGAGGLNFCVRDGNRCFPSAIATVNL